MHVDGRGAGRVIDHSAVIPVVSFAAVGASFLGVERIVSTEALDGVDASAAEQAIVQRVAENQIIAASPINAFDVGGDEVLFAGGAVVADAVE
jgi:hypothetical protein